MQLDNATQFIVFRGGMVVNEDIGDDAVNAAWLAGMELNVLLSPSLIM
jgi:hypothetical protein